MFRIGAIALAAAATASLGGAAEAATIAPSGVTRIEVTAPLGALGLGAEPTGAATADVAGANPVFAFPITGGEIEGADLRVEHEGSGLSLFALDDPAVSATVGDFVVDTALSRVLGSIGDEAPIELFVLGSTSDAGIELIFTSTFAQALSGVFGEVAEEFFTFGFATTEAAPIPVPAALPLLAGGLAILGAVGLRRRRPA